MGGWEELGAHCQPDEGVRGGLGGGGSRNGNRIKDGAEAGEGVTKAPTTKGRGGVGNSSAYIM